MSAEVEICNLLYRYAELMDTGDLPGVAELLAGATIVLADDVTTDATGFVALLGASLVIYDDGTPRTRHVITNPIVEIDEVAGEARVRSVYTVVQQVPGGDIAVIAAGRYDDRFAHDNDTWRFAQRDYRLLDFVGDLSGHLRAPASGDA
jgi:3-phenylpropionate/cinnamic acid dioxygenase small subunit